MTTVIPCFESSVVFNLTNQYTIVMDVVVVNSAGGNIGDHAYSQLKDFGLETEVVKPDLVDVPGTVSRRKADAYLVICDSSKDFIETVVDKIVEQEVKRDIVMEKVLISSEGKSQEIFERSMRRKAGQAAEKLGEKLEK